MNVKSRNISSLIESQIPQFIVGEYEMFVRFLEAYYEHQELSGGVLDIVSNLTKYRDINFYSKNILKQSSKTTAITGISHLICCSNPLAIAPLMLLKLFCQFAAHKVCSLCELVAHNTVNYLVYVYIIYHKLLSVNCSNCVVIKCYIRCKISCLML